MGQNSGSNFNILDKIHISFSVRNITSFKYVPFEWSDLVIVILNWDQLVVSPKSISSVLQSSMRTLMFIECQMTLVMTIELSHQIINYHAAQDKWSVLRESGSIVWDYTRTDRPDGPGLVPSYLHYPSDLALLMEIHWNYIALEDRPMRGCLADHVIAPQWCYWLAIDLIDRRALNIDKCVNNLLQYRASTQHQLGWQVWWSQLDLKSRC